MPKNIKGGNKHKKQKNTVHIDKDIIYKNSEEQDYGKVIKLLGNCRVLLLCNDNKERLGIIRGSMRKKMWININNIILYSKRTYEDDKVDIIYVYNNEIVNENSKLMILNKCLKLENKEDDLFDNYEDSEEENYITDLNEL